MRRVLAVALALVGIWCLGQQGRPARSQDLGFAVWKTVASAAATTWNPAKLGAGLALSNGNLTATYTGASANNAGWATVSHATGKYYFEFSCTGCPSNALEIGVGNASAGTTGYQIGVSDSNSAGWGLGGCVFTMGASCASVDNCSALCAIAVDLGGSLIWTLSDNGLLRWNGSGTANPATGTGGLALNTTGPFFPMFSTAASGNIFTGNFGATAYNYSTIAATLATAGFGKW